MILFIEDNSGCQLRLLVFPLLIDGSIDKVRRELGQLKGEPENITKILKKN